VFLETIVPVVWFRLFIERFFIGFLFGFEPIFWARFKVWEIVRFWEGDTSIELSRLLLVRQGWLLAANCCAWLGRSSFSELSVMARRGCSMSLSS
jgi:hypothetical protein